MNIRKALPLSALLLGLLCPALSAQSISYYLEFPTDTVQGSVTAADYEGQVEVTTFNFGGNLPVDIGAAASGSPIGKVALEPIYLLIQTDSKALPGLFQNMLRGTHIPEVILRGVRDNDSSNTTSNLEVFLELKLLLVYVSEIQLEGVEGDRGVFNVVLEWGAMDLKTFSTNPQTGEPVANPSAIWSRVKNAAEYAVE
ncbi:type VI secretion system tube protein Hcp [Cerasicoccus frondis]|uniref:type VI secretion system tube protein Hcp n=1 Tax=Cerasicoccus frondis TaxID=490090 RepID=UPI0028525A33|nr:type VI secretion system tube protein Hcp [Cerasicoccus frondis]